jgi:hypothetical protein
MSGRTGAVVFFRLPFADFFTGAIRFDAFPVSQQ